MNVFKLKDENAVKRIGFAPDEIGFSPAADLEAVGSSFEKRGNRICVTVELPAYGHRNRHGGPLSQEASCDHEQGNARTRDVLQRPVLVRADKEI